MFDVWFEDADKKKTHVWQTSWGLSTRSIGSMIMVHSDNTGMVLPPRVAQTQVVIVPIFYKNDDSKAMLDKAFEIRDQLVAAGVRAKVDDSDTHNPGFKFNQWEVRGVPVRMELGKKDFDNAEVRVAVRHDGRKFQMKQDGIAASTCELLDKIHSEMFEKAKNARDTHIKEVDNWKDFMEALDGRNLCLAPWCDVKKCEVKIKDQSKEESLQKMAEANEDETLLTGAAKTLCIPYELGNQKLAEGVKCFYCGEQAKVTALWGRSY
jgi:prolyl-tRNA synthetase